MLAELFAPTIVSERRAAILTHSPWIAPDGLPYFRDRLNQAIAAIEFKSDVLWSLLDAVHAGRLPWTTR